MHICISSTAIKSTVRSFGIDSTVQIKNFGDFGMIFSSPVTSATFSTPIFLTHLSKISLANNLKGKPMIPES